MKSRLAYASMWAIAGSGLQYLVLFVLLAYLTRVLQPRDFGLMATLSIGLDLGLRVARWGQIELLQQPQFRTDAARNHAFRLSIGLASIMALLFVAAAWPLGQYFASPELTVMSYLCAPVIVLAAAGSTAEAILRNEFRFQQIAYRNTVSTLIGGAVALLLAVRGYGAIALAVQQLVQAGLGAIWVWAAIAWRPSFASKPTYVAATARQGGSIMMASLLPQLIPRSFDLWVGLMLGPVALGIMRVANRFNDFVGQMVSIPLNGVASVQFSTMSDDVRALRWSYLQMTQASAAIICPVIVGVGLVAPEAVPLLFGSNWDASIPIVQISSLLALTMPISYYFAPAMVALGGRQILVRQSLFDVGVGVTAAIVAAGISLQAVAVAMVLRSAFTSTCNARDLHVHMHLSIRDLARNLAPPYTATLAMVVSVTVARFELVSNMSQLITVVILANVGAIAYLGTLLIGAQLGLWPNYIDAIKRLFPKTVSSS